MNWEEAVQQYVLNDGRIEFIGVRMHYGDPAASEASVQLQVRKRVTRKAYVNCLLRLELAGVTEVVLTEDFGASYYSNIVLARLDNDLFYLSLDPYGNSGVPHDKDNLVIVAKALIILES